MTLTKILFILNTFKMNNVVYKDTVCYKYQI